jgi:hypothetical protein
MASVKVDVSIPQILAHERMALISVIIWSCLLTKYFFYILVVKTAATATADEKFLATSLDLK